MKWSMKFTLSLMIATFLLLPQKVLPALAYQSGVFMVGIEDVGTAYDTDLDNNDAVMSVRYLAQYNNSCTQPSGNCLVNLIMVTTPMAAGATHSLGLRMFPFGPSDFTTTYDYVEHGTSSGTRTNNHVGEVRFYEGISDMFTCGASTFVNTLGVTNCQGKARAFSFYFEDNQLELIDVANFDNMIADFIHLENYTLCKGTDTNANSSDNALIYSIYGKRGPVPVEYTDFFTAYELSTSTTGAQNCDAKNGFWGATCYADIATHIAGYGSSFPTTVIQVNNSGVFTHPTWEIAKWDGTSDTFSAYNWTDSSSPSAKSGSGMAQIFGEQDLIMPYMTDFKDINSQRSFSQIIDPVINSNQHSGGGGAVPSGASCGSPP